MGDLSALAELLIPITIVLTTGGVLVLRPIAKRLGVLLEVMAKERTQAPSDDLRRLQQSVDTMNERLSLIEERQDFTERLIGRGGSEGGGKLTE
ncbi:MAG: hypothetical protein F4087_15360 [Gemmatimonadetes bacterium]|nr:hypothetical protein [Gemmatimonadota bacterium]MXX36163.1 hypothetical protein [Gemmatimonadota bacterium]MYA10863.1 hypothetical protein [Gemmatimonadota bacterium]MYD15315.1 hypothetical protein [Gemmatimonadota bacterium]MYE69746.1 hypothetical protein [Gemmatimonadota bacterium]